MMANFWRIIGIIILIAIGLFVLLTWHNIDYARKHFHQMKIVVNNIAKMDKQVRHSCINRHYNQLLKQLETVEKNHHELNRQVTALGKLIGFDTYQTLISSGAAWNNPTYLMIYQKQPERCHQFLPNSSNINEWHNTVIKEINRDSKKQASIIGGLTEIFLQKKHRQYPTLFD